MSHGERTTADSPLVYSQWKRCLGGNQANRSRYYDPKNVFLLLRRSTSETPALWKLEPGNCFSYKLRPAF